MTTLPTNNYAEIRSIYSPSPRVSGERVGVRGAVSLFRVGKKYPLIKPVNSGVSGEFKDYWALKDVTFDIRKGEVFGIIGRNGAGKTTLLNIIAGVLSQTEGEVSREGRALGLFNLGVGFQDQLTGRENIYLNGAIVGAAKKELDSKLGSIIEFSELGNFINMPLGSYSTGMRLRLAFSIIANLDFDILVVDEVLAVGDALFQSKCFQRLMDLKRSGKTLIITTQGMELIERLCDKALLLDHGRPVFCGEPKEAIDKYRRLLNTEKFFVGPLNPEKRFIEDTKKWANDISEWGQKTGTKEVEIDRFEFTDKFGGACSSIKSREPLKIKVWFTAKNEVKYPHFGAAIFRSDGVYCYGPNTAFDSHYIPRIMPGKGSFSVEYKNIFLAPGEYKVSVAIWDKNETLAFDYHNGCYGLKITGYKNTNNELLNMPIRIRKYQRRIPSPPKGERVRVRGLNGIFCHFKRSGYDIDLSPLSEKWGQKKDSENVKILSLKLLDKKGQAPYKSLRDYTGQAGNTFITNEPVSIVADFDVKTGKRRDAILWLGIYRDDGVLCQSISGRIPLSAGAFEAFFPHLSLLPGGYKISAGIWSITAEQFLAYHHGIYPFKMIFDKQDHGTVYLEHSWKWSA